jgi:alpha-tubulin suppressor-like RCC1 family protein
MALRRTILLALALASPACSALLDLDGYRTRDAAVDVAARADIPAASDATDVPALPDVSADVSDAPNVLDTADVVDATDFPDAADVPDAPGVSDVPGASDAPDVSDVLDASDVPAPQDVSPDVPADAGALLPPSAVAQVVAGYLHTCALLEDRSVYCWGHNEFGQIGIGQNVSMVTTPMRVDLAPVAALVAGAHHTCARTVLGEVFCWGRNGDAQLGDGSTLQRGAPVRVAGLAVGAWSLAAGATHTCATLGAADRDAPVFCWGSNVRGESGQPVGGTSRVYVMPTQVPTVSARGIAAGEAFTCAVGERTAWCWGRNLYGELAAPTSVTVRGTPTAVPITLSSGERFESVVAGGFAVCARSNVATRCWGRGDLGAIPPGSAAAQTTPVEVPVYADQSLVFGYVGQCAVDASGAMRCWGSNDLGAAGDGTNDRRTAYPASAILQGVRRDGVGRAIAAAGPQHVCAATADGALRCWGAMYYGHLGDGRRAVVTAPREVPALRGARSLAAGTAFTCGVFDEGGATRTRCVGYNGLGQLGGSRVATGTVPSVEPTPVTVQAGTRAGPALITAQAVCAGTAHACALAQGGAVHCWGWNNSGQIGNAMPSTGPLFAAQAVPGVSGVVSVSAGSAHTCLVVAGAVTCFGQSDRGQCGYLAGGSPVMRATVPGVATAQEVAAGAEFTCARLGDGRLTCWGDNTYGQCAVDPAVAPTVVPMNAPFSLPLNPSGVTAGLAHACAWNNAAGVWCWGVNNRGQLGQPSSMTSRSFVPLPVPESLLSTVAEVAAGVEFTCARTTAGAVLCWGSNTRGQLGDGTLTDRSFARVVPLPAAAVQVVTGAEHACARLQGGAVHCWGANQLAQLGLTDPLWQLDPTTAAVRWPR